MKQPHMASSSHAAEADVRKKGYLLKVKVEYVVLCRAFFDSAPPTVAGGEALCFKKLFKNIFIPRVSMTVI